MRYCRLLQKQTYMLYAQTQDMEQNWTHINRSSKQVPIPSNCVIIENLLRVADTNWAL